MQITKVTVSQGITISKGKGTYEFERHDVTLEAEIDEHESYEDACAVLRQSCREELEEAIEGG